MSVTDVEGQVTGHVTVLMTDTMVSDVQVLEGQGHQDGEDLRQGQEVEAMIAEGEVAEGQGHTAVMTGSLDQDPGQGHAAGQDQPKGHQ